MNITKKSLIKISSEIDHQNRWNRFDNKGTKDFIFIQLCNIVDDYLENKRQVPEDKVKLIQNLRDDDEFISEMFAKNGHAFGCASHRIKSDKHFVLTAVQLHGHALKYASEELRNDKEIVLQAVAENGLALHHASENLRSDKEVVLAALRQNGTALQYAADNLKSDKEIVLEAVKQTKWAIKDACPDILHLCKDKDSVKILESMILAEDLQNSLLMKTGSQHQKKRMKI